MATSRQARRHRVRNSSTVSSKTGKATPSLKDASGKQPRKPIRPAVSLPDHGALVPLRVASMPTGECPRVTMHGTMPISMVGPSPATYGTLTWQDHLAYPGPSWLGTYPPQSAELALRSTMEAGCTCSRMATKNQSVQTDDVQSGAPQHQEEETQTEMAGVAEMTCQTDPATIDGVGEVVGAQDAKEEQAGEDGEGGSLWLQLMDQWTRDVLPPGSVTEWQAMAQEYRQLELYSKTYMARLWNLRRALMLGEYS